MERGALKRPGSVLDGFFTDDVALVAAASRALRADPATLDDGDRSWGRVVVPEVIGARGRAHRDGLWSDVIFGPRRALACNCGKYVGTEHEGVVCEKCGVLVGDPSLRAWRFGHIECAPLIHPLLAKPIADALGLAVDDVRTTLINGGARDDTDDDRVADLVRAIEEGAVGGDLADAAIVTRVPVPPPDDRGLVENLTPSQKIAWMGPVNHAWCDFVMRTNRRARLVELHAPPIILMHETRMHQSAFAKVVAATQRTPALHERTWWTPQRSDDDVDDDRRILLRTRAPRVTDTEAVDDLPRAIVFLDEHTVLVQQRRDCVVIDVDGSERFRFASPALQIRSVHGARVVFEGGPPLVNVDYDDEQLFRNLAVFDFEARAMLEEWPDDIACVHVVSGEPEDLWILDVKANALLVPPWGGNDRPELLAWTRDAKYAWVGSEDDGGVLDVDTGIPQIEPRVDLDFDEESAAISRAIALTPSNEWRFVHADGAVSDGDVVIDRIGAHDAVAFSPDCTLIATLLAGVVTIAPVGGDVVKSFRV